MFREGATTDYQVLQNEKCKGKLPGLMSVREELLKDRKAFWRHRNKEIEDRRAARSDGAADGEI